MINGRIAKQTKEGETPQKSFDCQKCKKCKCLNKSGMRGSCRTRGCSSTCSSKCNSDPGYRKVENTLEYNHQCKCQREISTETVWEHGEKIVIRTIVENGIVGKLSRIDDLILDICFS